jgi:hypothetical protein
MLWGKDPKYPIFKIRTHPETNQHYGKDGDFSVISIITAEAGDPSRP